jgi:hypothetical protein
MSNLRIVVPPQRAPRLPRDHFAMRPQTTIGRRFARALAIGAVIAYVFGRLHH